MSGAALVNAFNACAALSINVFSTDITLALFDISALDGCAVNGMLETGKAVTTLQMLL